MQTSTYKLTTESIELYKLLKLLQLVPSGGIAKMLIAEGEVQVNEATETRKRARIRPGDIVIFQDIQIHIA